MRRMPEAPSAAARPSPARSSTQPQRFLAGIGFEATGPRLLRAARPRRGSESPGSSARQRAVRGDLSEEMVRSVRQWSSPHFALKVFVSSTFTDTHHERNLLLEKILPDLREECRTLHLEDVILYDMRFGVQDANTMQHLTWALCTRAIERCYNESGGLFFLSLQGDKYGYRPLPLVVDKAVMEEALARHSSDASLVDAANKWYKLDENVAGGAYVLEDLDAINNQDWEVHVAEFCLLASGRAVVATALPEEEAALASGAIGPRRAYWYRRMPQVIDKSAYAALQNAACSDAVRAVAHIWYTERDDQMRLMDHFELRKLVNILHNDYWKIMEGIRDVLLGGLTFAVTASKGQDLLVGQSVTEWETRLALALAGARERSLWLHRRFDGGLTPQQDPWGQLDDGVGKPETHTKRAALKEHMRSALGPARIDDFAVKAESFLAQDAAWCAHLHAFEARVRAKFTAEFSRLAEKQRRWAMDGCGMGMPGAELAEVLHHMKWACAKVGDFEGREAELADAEAKVAGREGGGGFGHGQFTGNERPLSGVCLAVVGKSGAGKTAFTAKLAQRLSQERPDRPVLVRFCGTSRGSITGLALVQSLCLQMEHVFALPAVSPAPSGYKAWVKHLHSILREYVVVLVIDSLDQLSNDDEARSQLSFLKGVVPHADTRIVVSCLPDETDALTGKRYFYGCDTRLRESGVPRVLIEPLEEGDALFMVRQLLARQGRGLTSEQWAVVSASTIGTAATALYCRLSARVVATWRSSTNLNDCVLPPTVPLLIDFILEGLETEFGKKWARVALALITYSRAGVSDGEMQDLLSLNDEHVLNHVFQYSKPEGVRRLPLHVWLRLKDALEGLLVEREHGCCQWYHRQLKEAAEARYADTEKQLAHTLLGTYFGDLCGESGRRRLVARQPLSLDCGSVWLPGARVNVRRCVEAPFHLAASGNARELCSVDLVSACIKTGQGFELLRALLALDAKLEGDDEGIAHYKRWVLGDMSYMQANPQSNVVAACLANQPLNSCARRDLEAALRGTQIGASLMGMSAEEMRRAWFRGRCLGGRQAFDARIMTLQGHTDVVNAVAWSPDGRHLVSASNSSNLCVWDAESGQRLLTLVGHTNWVSTVAWSRPRIASGSWDRSVRVWDPETGQCIATLIHAADPTGYIYSVDWDPCGRRIAAGSWDQSVRVWDPETGQCVMTMQGHTREVVAVAWSPCGRRIASGSRDKSVRVWDTESPAGEHCIMKLEGHAKSVCAVAWSLVGLNIASASGKSIFLWNAETKQCIATLEGHKYTVVAVAWSPDGRSIASGSHDGTVRLWDAETALRESTTLGHHANKVYAVRWSPSGRRVASGSGDCVVHVWDAPSGDPRGTSAVREGHDEGAVTAVDFSPNGSLAASSSYKSVRIWDVESGLCRATLVGHGAVVKSVSWSHAGHQVASGSYDHTVRIWDAKSGLCASTLTGHSGWVNAVAWSFQNGQLASGSYDHTVRIWVTATAQCVAVLRGHTDSVNSIAWSPDGLLLASGSEDRTIRVWAPSSGLGVKICLEGHAWAVTAVGWSRDGRLASSSRDDTIRLWDIEAGQCCATLESAGSAKALSWSPDGRRIAVSYWDNKLRIWNPDSRQCLASLGGHIGPVNAVKWSPCGRILLSGSDDGSVRLWDAVL